jgi:hypothetical protein
MNSKHWLSMLSTSYSNEIIRSLKPNGGRNMRKDYIMYVGNKMQDFDGIIVPKVE